MTYGIYCIEHTNSGRKYVGKSKHIERRIHEHFHKFKKAKHYLAHAIQKHGEAAFTWHVLEVITPECVEALAAAELRWIDALGVFASELGFNVKRDSSGCTEFAPEVRAKIAASVTGHRHTDETKAKFRERVGENNAFSGHTHSEQARKAIGELSKKRWEDPEYRLRMEGRRLGRSRAGYITPADVRKKQSAAAKIRWARQKGLTST